MSGGELKSRTERRRFLVKYKKEFEDMPKLKSKGKFVRELTILHRVCYSLRARETQKDSDSRETGIVRGTE